MDSMQDEGMDSVVKSRVLMIQKLEKETSKH